MPQVQLPIFPAGSVEINRELACRVEGEQVVYFNGQLPVFAHAKNDLASFRLFTSQLIVQGSATQGHWPGHLVYRLWPSNGQRSSIGSGGLRASSCLDHVGKARSSTPKSSSKLGLYWCKVMGCRWSARRAGCSRIHCA